MARIVVLYTTLDLIEVGKNRSWNLVWNVGFYYRINASLCPDVEGMCVLLQAPGAQLAFMNRT